LQGKKFLDKEEGDKRRSGKPIIASWHCSLGPNSLGIALECWSIQLPNSVNLRRFNELHKTFWEVLDEGFWVLEAFQNNYICQVSGHFMLKRFPQVSSPTSPYLTWVCPQKGE
jgi:hypothetical protein